MTKMTKRIIAHLIGFVGASALLIGSASAAGYPIDKPVAQSWSFAGIFGRYDRAQLQRGFQVYAEVCQGCHGLQMIAFRNLAEPGGPEFSEAAAKAIAAEYTVMDGPDSEGEMFERPARLSDTFPVPFANKEAAAASNNGAVPPDFSLIAKARGVERGFPWFIFDIVTQYQEGGADYIHGLLTNYKDAPEGVTVDDGTYYNTGFIAGKTLAMAPPLEDESVDYTDGSPMTLDQYSRDVTAFLMWAAEPKLEERKRIGFQAMIFMIIFAGMMYLVKRKIWSKTEH